MMDSCRWSVYYEPVEKVLPDIGDNRASQKLFYADP